MNRRQRHQLVPLNIIIFVAAAAAGNTERLTDDNLFDRFEWKRCSLTQKPDITNGQLRIRMMAVQSKLWLHNTTVSVVQKKKKKNRKIVLFFLAFFLFILLKDV